MLAEPVRRYVNLKSVFTRIARSGNTCRSACYSAIREPIILDVIKPRVRQSLKSRERFRPLNGQLRVAIASEVHFGFKVIVRTDMLKILLLVGGVNTQKK